MSKYAIPKRLEDLNAIDSFMFNELTMQEDREKAEFFCKTVDSHIFSSGQKYTALDSVVVIFIFPYDPFGYDRMLYTVKRKCLEEPDMPFNDGDTTYFLNATGTKDIPSQSLKNMLSFLIDSSAENAKNEELKAVRNMMNQIKQDRQMGVKYMYTWERENHIRNEGIEEGIKQGIEQGIEQGIDKKICGLISTKLSKGKSIAQIADEIEESEDKVLELIHQYNLK